MKFLIAPDSFKESVGAAQAARAIAEGLRRVLPGAQFDLAPMADGGQGTLAALVAATKGREIDCPACDPLGRSIMAAYGVTGRGNLAIVEIARAAGLALLRPEERDPLRTTSRGAGMLIRKAIDDGFRRIIVCLGGSATNDGGCGLLSALGFEFRDASGNPVQAGGAGLATIASIDMRGVPAAVRETSFIVACDVRNPLLGKQGASRTYAAQKGARERDLDVLEAAMTNFARVAEKTCGRNIADFQGAGAAGGIGAALVGFLAAEMRSGAALVADTIDLERRMGACDLILTGEGKLDSQTPNGKVVSLVASLAKKQAIPVIAVAGALGPGYEVLYEWGLSAVFPILDGIMTLQEALGRSEGLLIAAGERIGRLLLIGGEMPQMKKLGGG